MKAKLWIVVLLLALTLVGYFLLRGGDEARPVGDASPAVGATATVVSPTSAADVAVSRATSTPAPETNLAADGAASVPAQYQFAGVTEVATGESFEDWMNQYPLAEQATLRDFDSTYFGVWQDRTPEEIAWMAAHGYPMPEDVLAAKAMSTQQLRQLTDQGNTKAAYFLRIRAKQDMARLTAAGLPESGAPGSDAAQLVATLKPVKSSGSPFKAYLTAWSMMPGYTGRDEEGLIISHLQWAAFLGDHGARARIEAFVDAAPNFEDRELRQAMAGSASWLSLEIHDSMRHRGLPDYCRAMISSVPGKYPTKSIGDSTGP